MEQRILSSFEKDMMNYVEQHVSATPAQFDEVDVEIRVDGQVFVAYVDELYANLTTAISMKGGSFPVSKEDFISYCESLVKLRVRYVRGERVTFGPTERIVVPSYLSCVLSNIGKARHLDFGIELTPKMEDTNVMDANQMRRISNALTLLRGIGFEYAEGYTRSREGSFDFMAMTLMDGIVKSISKDAHPVYALLSSTLCVRGIETVLSPRITYGMVSHLASLVRGLATLKV